MFDTTTQHGFAPLGMPGHQPAPYGQQFGQPQNAGFVPIIGLVPQSLLVNLVAQCLQQAQLAGLTQQVAGSPLTPQGLFGHGPGQLGQLQPFGLPQQLGQLLPLDRKFFRELPGIRRRERRPIQPEQDLFDERPIAGSTAGWGGRPGPSASSEPIPSTRRIP